MRYTKKVLVNLQNGNNIAVTTAQNIMELMLLALENGLAVKREDIVVTEPNADEKRPRGRPRQFPPKVIY